MIIGLGGKKCSGKTAAAEYLSKKYNLKKVAFASSLKKIVSDISGLNDDYKEDVSPYDKNIEFKIINSVLKKSGYKSLDQSEIDNLTAIEYHTKGQVYRLLLQYIGTNIFRKRNPNHWIEAFINANKNLKGFVCDDIRFPNEHNAIKYKFKDEFIKTIKVICPNNKNVDAHESELMIDRINFDYTS